MSAIVAITGTSSKLNEAQIEIITRTLAEIESEDIGAWWTGAAKGVDAIAAGVLLRLYPEAKHRVLIPRWRGGVCKHYKPGVVQMKRMAKEGGVDLKVVKAPNTARSEAAGLLLRDDVLAVNCTHMVGFPSGAKEEQRSGTWATLRRAWRLNRPTLVVPLDGSKRQIHK